jgi:hypothetical protein
MQRRAFWLLGSFLVIALGTLALFNRYKLDLVHSVVEEATVQKAAEQDRSVLRAAFEEARLHAERNKAVNRYLEKLFEISQRVEKVQRLTSQGTEDILRILGGAD